MGQNGWIMVIFITLVLFATGLIVVLVSRKLKNKAIERTGITMIIATALMSSAATLYAFLSAR